MLPGAALDVPRCACTPPSHPSHRDPRIPSSSPPPPPCVLTFLLLAVVSERRQRSGIGRAKFFFSSSATASPRSHRTAHTATTARTNSHAHRYDTAHTSDCIGRFQRATPAHASDRSSAQRSAAAQSSQRRHRAAIRLCVSHCCSHVEQEGCVQAWSIRQEGCRTVQHGRHGVGRRVGIGPRRREEEVAGAADCRAVQPDAKGCVRRANTAGSREQRDARAWTVHSGTQDSRARARALSVRISARLTPVCRCGPRRALLRSCYVQISIRRMMTA